MKVAIPYDNGAIFPHFGRCAQFKVYTIAQGRVQSSYLLPAGGEGHGAKASALLNDGVDALICGGIGDGARALLYQVGVTLYPGVTGEADLRAEELAQGELDFDVQAAQPPADGHDCSSCQASDRCTGGSCRLG